LHAAELACGGTLHTVPALWWLMLLMEMKKNQDATETKTTTEAFYRLQLMSSYCMLYPHQHHGALYPLHDASHAFFSEIKIKHET
jgi:hypothetical protein